MTKVTGLEKHIFCKIVLIERNAHLMNNKCLFKETVNITITFYPSPDFSFYCIW